MFYLKITEHGHHPVKTLDSCDFIRMILPPDPGDKLLNVQDYYRNGKLQMVGKTKQGTALINGDISLMGSCIRFYPNGKRKDISNYDDDWIQGIETEYYPDGSLFCTINHLPHSRSWFWDCYDNKGEKICTNGNGTWIKYDNDLKTILAEGPVKNGESEGEWHEITYLHDTIKYTAIYKNGLLKSGTSYDKAGNKYSFTAEQQIPFYEELSYFDRDGYFNFLDDVKRHLKRPRDADGKKMSLDSVYISFVIERDNHLSQFGIIGTVDPKLQSAIFDALAQCKGWHCRTYYGIPLKSGFVFPIRYLETWDGRYDKKSFYLTETVFYP